MKYALILFKGITNTLVRLLPISIYMGSIMSSLIFDNKRANILLIGFILIELIGFGYNSFGKVVSSPNCALIRSENYNFALPAPIPLSLGFFVSFLVSDMMATNQFNPSKFYILLMLLLLSVWSRINVGCHTIIESIFAAIVGVLLGVGYYNLVKDQYKDADYDNIPKDVSDEDSKIYQLLSI